MPAHGLVLVALIALSGCGGDASGSATPAVVQVTWTANREAAVNSAGGGYRVYHSSMAGFDIAAAKVLDLPFVSGSAPTSTKLTLPSGTHYIRVVAYSALNPGGSAASAEVAVTVP